MTIYLILHKEKEEDIRVELGGKKHCKKDISGCHKSQPFRLYISQMRDLIHRPNIQSTQCPQTKAVLYQK